ncbi:spore germination protein KC [Paenibacillus forsythiae]|uniref:Spore germination protein KC n=1 Tax=Paenibacillus forsythiae TaxID=365616 RepID=A0ABU3HCT9_9BACL|nr:Ger(x)C family spore germination protein [Paenibacillus forsythiae]MDT3428636.1 spore germination protein KC [Paenibacillus forsythiae]
MSENTFTSGNRRHKMARGFLLAVSLLSLLTGGCWDDRELNELGIVSGSAYDWKDNQWLATYQVINPSSGSNNTGGSGGGSSSSPPFLTYAVTGSTIMQAVERTNLTSTRQLFFSHSRITVIGESLAKRGISQLIDLFLRKPDARETVYVFIAKGEAGRILSQLMQLTKNQGAGIQLMIEQEARLTSYYPGIQMFELAMQLTSESASAAVPEIMLSGGKVMDRTDDIAQTDLPSRIKFGRLAVLKGDRFVGWLSQHEAYGLSFMTDKIQKANISFPSIPEKGDKDDASFTLLHSSTAVRPVWEKDHFVMDIDIEASGTLTELGSNLKLEEDSTVRKLENSIAHNILEIVQTSWGSVQKLNADVTGFAVAIHRHYPQRWKRIEREHSWDTVFQNIEIRPHAKVKITRIGLNSNSYNSLDKK